MLKISKFASAIYGPDVAEVLLSLLSLCAIVAAKGINVSSSCLSITFSKLNLALFI